jgi:hypothetical protein
MLELPPSQIVYRGITLHRSRDADGSPIGWTAYVPEGDDHRRLEAVTAPEILSAIDEALGSP